MIMEITIHQVSEMRRKRVHIVGKRFQFWSGIGELPVMSGKASRKRDKSESAKKLLYDVIRGFRSIRVFAIVRLEPMRSWPHAPASAPTFDSSPASSELYDLAKLATPSTSNSAVTLARSIPAAASAASWAGACLIPS